jgi:putative phage-type endonuclease
MLFLRCVTVEKIKSSAQENVLESLKPKGDKMSDRKEWLLSRKSYLGGSDIAAICGLSPYKTPLDVYLDKTNPEVDDSSMSEAAHFGTLLEETIANEYARRTGNKVTIEPSVIKHPEYDFLGANIDRWVNDKEFILECKTAGAHMAKDWGDEYTDEIPTQYLLQVAHYAFVCNKPMVEIALLLGGQTFKIYRYIRNATLEQNLLTVAQNFWVNHVLAKVAPEPATLPESARIYSGDNGSSITADETIKKKLETFTSLKARLKQIDEETKQLQLEIQNFMGEHSSIIDESNSLLATWKSSKPKEAFDLSKFKADYPELYTQYKGLGKPYRTFIIKTNKGDSDV